jgi:nitrite reductase/ring-hydroxylating ferredoxin subunit
VSEQLLCALAEIEDPGGRGFTIESGEGPREIFVVRARGGVYGYVNVCPHAGTPLDWRPHQFLSPDRSAIQCATHGARFAIATGECIAGPCRGARLKAVRISTRHDKVYLETII